MSNGAVISKDDAATMIDAWQEANPTAVKSHLYDAGLIQNMLDDTNTAGIRIYHGLNSEGIHVLILVCADSSENDLADNTIIENGKECPPNCNYSSYFNH